MANRSSDRILFFYRPKDTSLGVTRQTTLQMAKKLGMNETELIHLALAKLSTQIDSMYPIDDGPITQEQGRRIQAHADKFIPPGESVVISHLFENVEPT